MAWPGRCDAGPSTGTTRVSPVERQRARAMDRNVPDPEFASRPAGDHNGSRGPLPQGGAKRSGALTAAVDRVVQRPAAPSGARLSEPAPIPGATTSTCGLTVG